MKKLVLTAAVLGFAASMASAQVYSLNIVGYNKLSSGNGLTMVSVPFNIEDSSVSNVVGNTLPLGSKVYVYDNGYTSTEYAETGETQMTPTGPLFVVTGTNWVPSLDLELGSGYWFEVPEDATEAPYTTITAGEVLLTDTFTNTLVVGLNLVSSPYPVETAVTNFGFAAQATLGDKVYVYDSGYASAEFAETGETQMTPTGPQFVVTGTNWVPGTLSVPVGAGFWYEANSEIEWIEERPFDL